MCIDVGWALIKACCCRKSEREVLQRDLSILSALPTEWLCDSRDSCKGPLCLRYGVTAATRARPKTLIAVHVFMTKATHPRDPQSAALHSPPLSTLPSPLPSHSHSCLARSFLLLSFSPHSLFASSSLAKVQVALSAKTTFHPLSSSLFTLFSPRSPLHSLLSALRYKLVLFSSSTLHRWLLFLWELAKNITKSRPSSLHPSSPLPSLDRTQQTRQP
ncbi:MAG: hypothetical protein J3Q66DRAFT_173815 [Benniella sp.]|nr:MAG: hypothetical protein J3Q66DRAFT_173815 [Benniella sp.]